MPTGRVFDIKRYALHDGPGIRTTVFFKGCPLHCRWCQNPEGIEGKPELMHWENRCSRCHACIAACPEGAISADGAGSISINRMTCTACGKCAEACLNEAMQIAGYEMTVDDVLREVERDRIFYEQSGGGVTLSGGDPLVQPRFLEGLLDGLRARRIHTALDTTGLAPAEVLERVAPKTDLILYDLKIMNDAKHRELTGVSNGLIIDNLKRLAVGRTEVWVRIPLLAGVNDDDGNLKAAMRFLRSLGKVRSIGLLPYHSGGCGKARRLGKESLFRTFEPPSEERSAAIQAAFREAGFDVKMGG